MGRFAYEYQIATGLFKFYDNNSLAYFTTLPSEDAAKELAEQLIEEVQQFESSK